MNNTVRTYLIGRARRRTNQAINYQALSDECHLGINMQHGQHIRNQMASILGDISRYEHENGRPLLSSLVLRLHDNYEGDGFFKLAESLGFGNWQTLRDNELFEVQQIRQCISFWSNDSNYRDFG